MARIFQDSRQKRELGAKAPWHVEWIEGGKRRSLKVGSKMEARERAKQIDARLIDGAIGLPSRKTWAEFRDEYERMNIAFMRSERSKDEFRHCLSLFEKVAKPVLMRGIDARTLDEYKAARFQMPGRKPNSTVAGETVRKELRTIRAALEQARKWGYILVVPDMPSFDSIESEKRFMTWDDFNTIWHACRVARMPKDVPNAAAWWRALLMTFWVTGCRVGALLQAEWERANLDEGFISLQATTTKQKKVHRIDVRQVADHLLAIRPEPATGLIFPWTHHRRTLDVEWDRIQTEAGIHLLCNDPRPHECTDSCHLYGFHDMRRSLATYNHALTDFESLMAQMGHANRSTTERYIKFADEHKPAKRFEAYLGDLRENHV